jgi:hypothetical protein
MPTPGLLPGATCAALGIRFDGKSAAVAVAHVAPGKDRCDLRYHLVDRDWDVFVGRHPVVLLRGAAEEPAVEAAGLDRPVIEKAVGERSTPPEGDVAGTHNGLRSHGCFRCLVIRLGRTHWSGFRQIPTGGEFEMSKRVSGCNRAVKQGDSKKGRTGEFGKDIFGERAQPPGLHPAPGLRASKRRIKVKVRAGVSRRGHA